MGFNIGDVEALEYNFGSYGDGETHPIKEPTDKQVRQFFKKLSKETGEAEEALLATIKALDGETAEQTAERLRAHKDELADAQVEISAASRHRVLGFLAEVCSGDPSVEQLEKLPERGQTEFLRYIRTELVPKG